MPVILAQKRHGLHDEFKASLGCIVKACLKERKRGSWGKRGKERRGEGEKGNGKEGKNIK